MYESSTRMSGWNRVLAIIFGLFVIGVGFAAIFFPAIVVGFLTVLFSIAFIVLGFWALSVGISGQRDTLSEGTGSATSSRQGTSSVPDKGVTTQSS